MSLITPPATLNTIAPRTGYDRKTSLRTSWHYMRMTYAHTSTTLTFNMDSILVKTYTTIPLPLSAVKQYNIILCPIPPSPATTVDCSTVIAHIKLWLTTTRRFTKLCDFRQGLEPSLFLMSYWPLTYNVTELPIAWDELTDLGPYKFRVKKHFSH